MNDFEGEVEELLDLVCVDWGFSVSPEQRRAISGRQRLTSREFALAVLLADGFQKPEREVSWIRRLKRRFAQRFDSDVISR